MRKTKEEQILLKFVNLEQTCWKLETNYVNMRLINDKIRNF